MATIVGSKDCRRLERSAKGMSETLRVEARTLGPAAEDSEKVWWRLREIGCSCCSSAEGFSRQLETESELESHLLKTLPYLLLLPSTGTLPLFSGSSVLSPALVSSLKVTFERKGLMRSFGSTVRWHFISDLGGFEEEEEEVDLVTGTSLFSDTELSELRSPPLFRCCDRRAVASAGPSVLKAAPPEVLLT